MHKVELGSCSLSCVWLCLLVVVVDFKRGGRINARGRGLDRAIDVKPYSQRLSSMSKRVF